MGAFEGLVPPPTALPHPLELNSRLHPLHRQPLWQSVCEKGPEKSVNNSENEPRWNSRSRAGGMETCEAAQTGIRARLSQRVHNAELDVT